MFQALGWCWGVMVINTCNRKFSDRAAQKKQTQDTVLGIEAAVGRPLGAGTRHWGVGTLPRAVLEFGSCFRSSLKSSLGSPEACRVS